MTSRSDAYQPRQAYGLAVLIAFGLTSCATGELPRAQSEGGKPWRRIEGPHADLVTDMDEGPARAAALQIEMWWSAMAEAMPVEAIVEKGNPWPLTVMAVRNRWESEAISQTLYGFYRWFAGAGPILYVGDPTDLVGRETVRHELAHAFVSAHLFDVPRWVNEGLAQYLETAEYDEGARAVTWGDVGSLDTANFLRWGQQTTVRNLVRQKPPWTASENGRFTYQAGLLMHMLINRHRGELDCFLRALGEEQPSEPAFKRCFSSYPGWEREFDDYKYSFRFATKTVPAAIQRPGFEVSPVHDGEVFALLALVDFTIAEFTAPQFRQARFDRAEANIQRASTVDPYHPFVVGASMGMNPDPVRCARMTSEIVSLHPDDWRAWRLRARTPGLSSEEANAACNQTVRTAPAQMAERALSPCVRVSAIPAARDEQK